GYSGESMPSESAFAGGQGLICEREPPIYALGRYFAASDPRRTASTLTQAVLELDRGRTPAPELGIALARAIRALRWIPDCIVPIPPSSPRDPHLFRELLRSARRHLPSGAEIIPDGLCCVSPLPACQHMNAVQRERAIRGAFVSTRDWEGAKL